MKSNITLKVLAVLTIWLLYGGLIAMAIIFDGIYVQVVIDTSIMVISVIIGYVYKASGSKEQS